VLQQMLWKILDKARTRQAAEIALLRPAQGGDLHVAIGYPNTYRVGMSHLGIQLIYGFLNAIPGVICERFFLPDEEEMGWYRASGSPLLTLESQRPVADFDLVAFTCNYEPDYTCRCGRPSAVTAILWCCWEGPSPCSTLSRWRTSST
jgi:hypothetical protein